MTHPVVHPEISHLVTIPRVAAVQVDHLLGGAAGLPEEIHPSRQGMYGTGS
jgi:hypothetical protein